MAAMGFVQSMGDSSRDSMGAKVACVLSCGVRGAVPAASRGRASASASAPTFANRSHREGRSSSGSMGVFAVRITSPASSSSAIYMMETPVSVSPLSMAQLIGAEPRYLGSRDA